MTETSDELMERIASEVIAEEKAKLAGPECSPDEHVPVLDFSVSGAKSYSHCDKCERALKREDPDESWRVVHHVWCKCRDCAARKAKP